MVYKLRVSTWPVRSKLTLAFLVAGLLPLAVFAAASQRATEGSLQKQAGIEMRKRGVALRAALDSRGLAVQDQIVSYGYWTDLCRAIDRRDVAWIEDNATTWVVDNSPMKGAQALTPDGTVVSAAGDFAHVSLSGSPVVVAAREALQNGFDFQAIDGRLFIVGAGPVVPQDVKDPALRGIVVFGQPVKSEMLAELASFIGASELNTYVNGRLVASSAGTAARPFPAGSRIDAISTSGSDTFLLTELRDRAGRSQAVLGFRVDNAAVAVTTSTLRRTALYALTAALIIALVVGVVVSRLLSRPLQRLATAARAIAGGATLQRVSIDSRDEFGEVATAFNVMSEQLSEAFTELERRSDTDELTGLLNYRAITRAVEKETARGRRYGVGFSLLVLDIDDFKLLNDTHGHPAGDQVLRQVGRHLSEHTRDADLVGRQGGDEFMIIMPETRVDGAAFVAEKVRAAMSDAPYITADEQRIPIRVSIGLASFPEDGGDVDQLLAQADVNLYASKRHGGDAVTHGGNRPQPTGAGGAFGVLESLVTAIDNKDNYTYRHSNEVTECALQIAEAVGLSAETQRVVRVAGLLHDVGKIGIPDDILRKPGRLTPDEYEIVKQHPQLGELIIQQIPNLEEIRTAVVSHHERWDGRGYPQGLSGEAIPLLARIMSVADACSAMTSDRPYHKGLTNEEAAAELRACAGTQFDPQLVELCIERRGLDAGKDPRDAGVCIDA